VQATAVTTATTATTFDATELATSITAFCA